MYVARTKIRGTKSNAKPISEDKDTYVVICKYVIPTMDYSMLRDSRRVKKNDSRLIYVLIATFFSRNSMFISKRQNSTQSNDSTRFIYSFNTIERLTFCHFTMATNRFVQHDFRFNYTTAALTCPADLKKYGQFFSYPSMNKIHRTLAEVVERASSSNEDDSPN